MPPPDTASPANSPNSAASTAGWRQRILSQGVSWYYAAALCLLLAAAVTRFYQLPEHTLHYDEASVVVNVRGVDFTSLLYNIRHRDTSPLLMPLILYGVQRSDGSVLAIRLPAATASVLTIALILFLLPRWGIPRWAALLAALLAAVSPHAILHAQDARIYGVDALVATLLIAGLLAYLHRGHKILLAAAMFLAPLVWYGLLLFGAAILATALLAPKTGAAAPVEYTPPPPTLNPLRRRPARLWHWLGTRLKRRKYLALPAGLFLSSALLNYLLILRYQIMARGYGRGKDTYLQDYYYPWPLNPLDALDWWSDRSYALLNYHLPDLVALAAMAAFGLVLLTSWRRRQWDAVTILALFALAFAAFATLLRLYPLGGLRQCLYLGPIIFLTAGLSLHRVAANPWFCRFRSWLSAALLAALAGAILFTGVAELRAENPYAEHNNFARHLYILPAEVQDHDLVYAAEGALDMMKFYFPDKPPNYYYGGKCTWRYPAALEECIAEITAAVRLHPDDPARLWLLLFNSRSHIEYQLLDWVEQGYAAPIANEFSADTFLYRLPPTHPILSEARQFRNELRQLRDSLQTATPAARGEFDLYIRGQTLYYHKEPCTAADTTGWFDVDITPVSVSDLPAAHRSAGIDHRDFEFPQRGAVFDGQCLAAVELPDYPIADIALSRFVAGDYLWQTDLDLKPAYYRAAYRSLIAGEPALNAVFAVYLQSNTLHYYKEPCAPADAEPRFFLHLIPIDPADLPDERRQYGVDNMDFDFSERGAVFDGKCLTSIPLPDYPFTEIRTGQFILGGNRLWEGSFPVDQTNYYRAAYAAITAGQPAARSSTFDLYRDSSKLHYAKEPCAPADTEPRFFLHLIPQDAAHLPPERQEHGSLNRDFDFAERGAIFDGKCLAILPLPDYPLTEIRTGQFTPAGRLWDATLPGQP